MQETDSPRYIQIANQLRNSIQTGHYQTGDRLPAESQLAQQFQVNRHTLRQAVSLLRQEGTLRVERGKGTFVSASPIRYAIGKRVRYNQSLKAQGHSVRFEILRSLSLPADATIAQNLCVPTNTPTALIERVSFVDDQPLSISSGYFPLTLFPTLLEPDSIQHLQTTGSISQWLRDRHAVDHIRQSTRVSARLVQPNDATHLALPLNQPILLVESVNIDQNGRVIEYGVTRLRGDRMELIFENTLHEESKSE